MINCFGRGLVAQNAERERQREQQGSNTSGLGGNSSIFSSRVSDSKFSLQSSTPSHVTTVTLHREKWKKFLYAEWTKNVSMCERRRNLFSWTPTLFNTFGPICAAAAWSWAWPWSWTLPLSPRRSTDTNCLVVAANVTPVLVVFR